MSVCGAVSLGIDKLHCGAAVHRAAGSIGGNRRSGGCAYAGRKSPTLTVIARCPDHSICLHLIVCPAVHQDHISIERVKQSIQLADQPGAKPVKKMRFLRAHTVSEHRGTHTGLHNGAAR